MKRYFKISPFYNGTGWYDTSSGILFNDKNKEYEVDKDLDTRKIDSYVIKNLLIETTKQHNPKAEEEIRNEKILKEASMYPASTNHLLGKEKYDIPVEKKVEEKEDIIEETIKEDIVEEVKEEELPIKEEIKEDEVVVEEKPVTSKSSSNKKGKKKK